MTTSSFICPLIAPQGAFCKHASEHLSFSSACTWLLEENGTINVAGSYTAVLFTVCTVKIREKLCLKDKDF